MEYGPVFVLAEKEVYNQWHFFKNKNLMVQVR